MARLLTCGWETGDIAEAGTTAVGTSNTVTLVSTAPTPRFGGAWCLKVLSSSGSQPLSGSKSFALASALTDVWIRCGVFLHSAGDPDQFSLVWCLDSAAVAQCCVCFDPVALQFNARRGANPGGTLLATSTTSGGYALDTWHLLEMRFQFTSTTVGIIEVWLNGARCINFSGDNTNAANANAQTVVVGAAMSAANAATGEYVAFDDIAINDTTGSFNNGRPGDGRVVLLVPTGAGSSTVLSRGGTDSGANWSQVDESPPSMTDYVYSATTGDRDLYAMADPSGFTVTGVNVVEEVVYAVNSDAGAGSLGLTIQSGGTVNEATSQALSSGAGYYRARWDTDPATGAAWTASAINAVQAGVTVR